MKEIDVKKTKTSLSKLIACEWGSVSERLVVPWTDAVVVVVSLRHGLL